MSGAAKHTSHLSPPGTSLSCQPQFGLIEEGVNLLLVVAGPQTGGRELFVSNLIGRQGRFPYSEKRIPDSDGEGVNLLHVVAGPQTGMGMPHRPDRR